MLASILREPDPLLHRKAKPVLEVTPDIRRFIGTMIETMHAAEGVGLAANQIGSDLAILVASPDGKNGNELVLINPRILKRSGHNRFPEGCLSLPGISSEVSRSAQVTVSGLNQKGEPVTLQADGLPAKILQHEVDHLEGRLFPDRLGFWQRRGLLRKYMKLAATLQQVKV